MTETYQYVIVKNLVLCDSALNANCHISVFYSFGVSNNYA